MKALSIRQPWAWLIVHGFKDIENREWAGTCHVRGEVLVHASQRCTNVEYSEAQNFLFQRELWAALDALPARADLELGGIVGSVRVVDAVRRHSSPWFNGSLGLVLADAKPIPFYSCKGALGFFNVEGFTPSLPEVSG